MSAPASAQWNFDTGLAADRAAELLVDLAPGPIPPNSWLRIRDAGAWHLGADGRFESPRAAEVAAHRHDLSRLHEAGFRLVVLLRWNADTWLHGTRLFQRAGHLPEDLRDAFDRCRTLTTLYGDLIDFWEIDNEPDISFVRENAETYTAYLKACYGGVQAARAEGHITGARVLMAPLALPPGPYFERFVQNGGLACTDAFNYHFYGYAEDFTGVYRQFERAVADAVSAPSENAHSAFYTAFFPSADGWSAETAATFDFADSAARANFEKVANRSRATEEPALAPAGRWLVSDGITIQETGDTWRFRVEAWPRGHLRAPVAELPLPAGWLAPPESLATFEYRKAESAPGQKTVSALAALRAGPADKPKGLPRTAHATVRAEPVARSADAIDRTSSSEGNVTRELPVFLTEYGYGALDPASARTPAGRERQARFFRSVRAQIEDLGIEGALAFLLTPYEESDLQEFGLLANVEAGAPDAARKWGRYRITPALDALLAPRPEKFTPHRWTIPARAASPIVIDFTPRRGLGLAKSYGGYFLEGPHGRSLPGEGEFVVYNFSDEPQSGRVRLQGDAWSLPDGTRELRLTLAPHARDVVPVHVHAAVDRFIAMPVSAWFEPGPPPAIVASNIPSSTDHPPPSVLRRPSSVIRPPSSAAPPESLPPMFECYFRTENGNLYQTWPRLLPTPAWQRYMQRVEDFTPAFYGRANLPWRLRDNAIVSLVFFFHPTEFPAIFEVRGASLTRFAQPK